MGRFENHHVFVLISLRFVKFWPKLVAKKSSTEVTRTVKFFAVPKNVPFPGARSPKMKNFESPFETIINCSKPQFCSLLNKPINLKMAFKIEKSKYFLFFSAALADGKKLFSVSSMTYDHQKMAKSII